MNFLSHFYIDRHHGDSLFFLGVATPDLVSLHDREGRLHKPQLPPFVEAAQWEGGDSFYRGVLRHFEADAVFHSSDFFHRETRRFGVLLREAFGSEAERSFFVAHILVELVLDKLIIAHDGQVPIAFYRHIGNADLDQVARLTEWISGRELPGYAGFLHSFVEREFLYRLSDQGELIRLLGRIIAGVGIGNRDYLESPRFADLVTAYEEELSGRWIDGFGELQALL